MNLSQVVPAGIQKLGRHQPAGQGFDPVRTLRGLRVGDRITLLEQALGSARKGEADALFDALVDLLPALERRESRRPRRQTVRQAAEIRLAAALHAHKLSPSRQGAVSLLFNGRFDEVVPRLLARGRPGRTAAASLLGEHVPRGLVQSMPELYRDADRNLAAATDTALLRYMVAAFPEHSVDIADAAGRLIESPRPAPADRTAAYREAVVGAVAASAWAFGEHHRARGPLVAAMVLLSGPDLAGPSADRLRDLLAAKDHPAASSLAVLVRTSPAPAARVFAFKWLGGDTRWRHAIAPGLASACAQRAVRAEAEREHVVVLARGHLALRPSRCLGLRRATHDHSGEVLPSRAVALKLPPRVMRGLTPIRSSCRLPSRVGSAAHRCTLSAPDVLTRLGAMRQAPATELSDWMFDADPRVARAAAHAWSSTATGPYGAARSSDKHRRRLASFAARSADETVARVARHELDAMDPWCATPPSRLRARRWARVDAAGFVRAVSERLRAGDRDEQAATIRLVCDLGMAARFAHELCTLADQATDTRLAASVVRALARVPGDRAARALEAAVNHADARVRANAVEALAISAERDGPSIRVSAMIEAKASDPAPRARANALRAAIASRGVIEPYDRPKWCERLRVMLHDDDARTRTSAAWVAERLLPRQSLHLGASWSLIAQDLTELADADDHPSVRDRCRRGVRRLLAHLHAEGRGQRRKAPPAPEGASA